MNFIRLMVWKEFRHIHADPLMARLIVFPVLAQILVLGYALTTEVKNTTIGIVDRCNTSRSVSLVQSIAHCPLFSYQGTLSDEERLRERMDRGAIKIGLVIPADFARRLEPPATAALHVLVDGQDANSSSVAGGYLNAIIQQWTVSYLKQRLMQQGLDIEALIPVTVSPVVLYNPMLKSTWYMIPGLVVILVTIITSLLVGLSIVKEKERGTFEQLMVTPIAPLHMLAGKVIPFVIIGLAEIAAFMVLVIPWFGIPFRGNVLTLFGFALIYMISSLGIGILTSTIARTSQQVLFLIWFILVFFLLLSGFFIPIANMPDWVQTLTCINPVRYFMFIVREIFLRGAGFMDLWREGVALMIIGTVVFALALVSFKRRVG